MYSYIYIIIWMMFEWYFFRFHHPSRGSQLNSPHLGDWDLRVGLESKGVAPLPHAARTQSQWNLNHHLGWQKIQKPLEAPKTFPKIGLWNKITEQNYRTCVSFPNLSLKTTESKPWMNPRSTTIPQSDKTQRRRHGTKMKATPMIWL